MSSLHVHDLAVIRGDRRIIADLGFSVGAGEVLHLEGRNGAGKTSLLEVLAGLRRADEGRIEGLPETQDRHWIGHKNALNAALTPLENLECWAGINGIRLAAGREALVAVGLKAQLPRLCGQLSTGQKRRAALARLIAVPRRWWLLDEPLAGLDAEGLAVFARLLGEHAAAGGSAIVTSHQPLPAELPGLRRLRIAA